MSGWQIWVEVQMSHPAPRAEQPFTAARKQIHEHAIYHYDSRGSTVALTDERAEEIRHPEPETDRGQYRSLEFRDDDGPDTCRSWCRMPPFGGV